MVNGPRSSIVTFSSGLSSLLCTAVHSCVKLIVSTVLFIVDKWFVSNRTQRDPADAKLAAVVLAVTAPSSHGDVCY